MEVHYNFRTDTGDSLHVNLAAVGVNVDGTDRYVCDFVRSVYVLFLRKQTQGPTVQRLEANVCLAWFLRSLSWEVQRTPRGRNPLLAVHKRIKIRFSHPPSVPRRIRRGVFRQS